jgi:maltooligosyltrehalose trehalohydrolase
VHAYLTGEREGYYSDYGEASQLAEVMEKPFLYAGSYSRFRDRKHGAPANHFSGDRFVVAVQNHDQVGNRARGERLAQLVCPARERLIGSLLCLAPHIPLIFMGQEYGEEHPFLFFCDFSDVALRDAVREGRRREFADFQWHGEVPDPNAVETFERSRMSWSWPPGSRQAGLRELYRDLLAARRQWPALRNFEDRQAFYLPGQHGDVLRLLRGGREYEYGRTIEALFNFTAETQVLKALPPAPQVRLFSSELSRYGGQLVEPEPELQLLPYECVVYGPPTWESFGD